MFKKLALAIGLVTFKGGISAIVDCVKTVICASCLI
jgi:hypothetical protein